MMKNESGLFSRNMILAFTAFFLVFSLTNADAATFTVSSTADAVDSDPGNGVCATAGGACTVRAAVMEANALAGTDTVTIPSGTFTIAIAGTNEDASATGDIDITESIVINGQGQSSTIMDGGALDRVFHIINTASSVAISGLTIQNGNIDNVGGGLYNDTASLTLNNVIITSNTASGNEGGGIYNYHGVLTLNDCLITQNTARYGAGVNDSDGSTTMTNTIISNNTGNGTWGGGGLVLENSSGATLTNVQIINNTGYTGGGIFAIPGAEAHITNSLINNNTSTQYGGGIYNFGGTMDIVGTTISNNRTSTSYSGAGIYNNSSSASYPADITIQKSSISGNYTADGGDGDGGGIYNTQSGGGIATVSLENVTLSGNTGDCQGGAIVNNGVVQILNSTISSNNARYCAGGGIYRGASGSTVIKNSILSNNTADGSNENCAGTGTLGSTGYNISSDASCSFASAGDMNSTDPLLGLLQDNGGITFTHELLSGSPAIDAGDNSGCPSEDQRGVSRPQDGNSDGTAICDAGAYEASSLAILSPSPGEELSSGEIYTIRWFAPAGAVFFNIEYSRDIGNSWKKISKKVTGNSYDWRVPVFWQNQTGCILKITSFDADKKKIEKDLSDAGFDIVIVKVTSPVEDEILNSGDTVNITWDTHVTKKPVKKVKLQYSKDCGDTWKNIDKLDGNPGSYAWTLPDINNPGECSKVQVILEGKNEKILATDESDPFEFWPAR